MAVLLAKEHIEKINKAINLPGKKEICLKIEDGKIVVLVVEKKKV